MATARTAAGFDRLRLRLLLPTRIALTEAPRWRRLLFALVLGVVAVGAMPPLYVLPLLIVAFTGLVWLVDSARTRRQAFATGWLFGLGYFTAGLYWVANAFYVQAEQFGQLAPFAVVGLSALLAMFTGGAALLAHAGRGRGIGSVLIFAAAWILFEWLKSWVLTGFPWNLIGSAWVFSDAMIQSAAVVGTYGLGLLTVIAAAMPAVLADRETPLRRALACVVIAFLVLAAVWAAGAFRLATAGPVEMVPDVRLRLVQPNIPQRLKFRRDLVDDHLAEHLRLSTAPAAPGDPPPTDVIWGETAAPLFLANDPERLSLIAKSTPPGGLTIVGTMRRSPPSQPFEVWNSLLAISGDGSVVGYYDKSHLVPFGEYVPLRNVIGISKFTAGTSDFSAGPGLRTLDLPGLPPVSPLICYEVIFPAQVTAPGERPRWLLNLTNDGWYGISAGPHQHFAAARLRAVEEGLPLVRVANTGISGIIDPYGRVIRSLGLGETGFVDGPLPVAAAPTPYARFGNWSPLLLVTVVAVLGLVFGHARHAPARRPN